MISKGHKDQIILGRDFMVQYHVLVDLVRREARMYMLEGGSPSLEVMAIDEEGDCIPLR